MIGLDTNVVVRLFVDDDMRQVRVARSFVAERCTHENPGYVNRVTLCELVWVLESVYRFKRAAVADVIERLLATRDIQVEDRAKAQAALGAFRSIGVDFADALVGEINRADGCTATATFDRKAARLDGFAMIG
jgi:predicted nucleic-acid-binding protein